MKDVLSEVLDTVALKGTLYFRSYFSPPFAIRVPEWTRSARFHVVVRGRCHVALATGASAMLEAGDLILVPNGSAHVMADAAGRTPTLLEEVMEANGYPNEGAYVLGAVDPEAATQLICGHFTFPDGPHHPLLRSLPDVFHFTAADRAALPILDGVVSLIVRRMFEDAPGTAASVGRLSEVLYIETLRAGIDRTPELKALHGAVHDPQIGRALTLIHHQVEQGWTVATLAGAVGMSRSRFAERFRDLVGVGPIGYLAEWRLQRARALLATPHLSVKDIARRTGYRSPSAFSRAYSHKFGASPKTGKARSG